MKTPKNVTEPLDSSELSFGLLPISPVPILAQVMEDGVKKHGSDEWASISVAEHIRHAFEHCRAAGIWEEGDMDGWEYGDEDHLAHACCRLWLALAKREMDRGTA